MEYIKGMTWGWVGIRGTWRTDAAKSSMHLMSERMGVNWVAIAFAALQRTAHTPEINFTEPPVVSDKEVRWAIREAKTSGLKVCLKPVVNCEDGTWRAYIRFFDLDVPCEPKWGDWFSNYGKFILHHAQIAQEEDCEMLCVGSEMVQTTHREKEWRELIENVRRVYNGIVVYNCDKYQEGQVQWWDAVDMITSSGFYPVDQWDVQIQRIKSVLTRWKKPFFFMEAGCRSVKGAGFLPNEWWQEQEVSMEEQQKYYEVMFSKVKNQSWCKGFMLWDWPVNPYPEDEASFNKDYCPFGKPAEQTIRDFYATK